MQRAPGVSFAACDPELFYWLAVLNVQHERLAGCPLPVLRAMIPQRYLQTPHSPHGDARVYAFDFATRALDAAGLLGETLAHWRADYAASLVFHEGACGALTVTVADEPAEREPFIHVELRRPALHSGEQGDG